MLVKPRRRANFEYVLNSAFNYDFFSMLVIFLNSAILSAFFCIAEINGPGIVQLVEQYLVNTGHLSILCLFFYHLGTFEETNPEGWL